uniref:T-cell receptor alpha/delta variable 36.2.12 n=1 Tax=Cyprinus carpio TaxID=7962 RepID=A0A8C1LIR0_CYPCA
MFHGLSCDTRWQFFIYHLKFTNVLLQMFSFSAAVFGNVIKPNKTNVVYEEGSSVTLFCSLYPGATDNLHWYRQYEKSKPEFLVLTYSSAKESQRSDVDPRFSVNIPKSEHVDLKISSAPVSDSALYYCALCTITWCSCMF